MKDKIMEEISTILHGNLITDEITEEQFICKEVIPVILPAIEAVIKEEFIEKSEVARRLDEIYMKTGNVGEEKNLLYGLCEECWSESTLGAED